MEEVPLWKKNFLGEKTLFKKVIMRKVANTLIYPYDAKELLQKGSALKMKKVLNRIF